MTTPTPTAVVIEVCGEGRTEVGDESAVPSVPDLAVLPVLVRRLCDNPTNLRVKRKRFQFLQRKSLSQKVWFFRLNASISGSAGCVFVLDSEGKVPVVRAGLEQGRKQGLPNFPTAIGIAHPCIESWLLSDASAIRRGFNLSGPRPTVPQDPESLPAPHADRSHNPKTILAACHPNTRHPNLAEKTLMAEHFTLATAEAVCPSFHAFAEEVRQHIRPLFPSPPPLPDETAANGEQPDLADNGPE